MNVRVAAVVVLLGLAGAAPADAASACTARPNFVLLLHGGTLEIRRDVAQRLEVIRQVLAQGRERLRSGATALDVAEYTVRMLEDSAAFNAGRGSNANRAGFIETDASIMDGNGMRAGSVASMRRVRNAVSAARLVMEKTENVMFVGDRGEDTVIQLGAESVGPEYFINSQSTDAGAMRPHGTVGAAVLDRCGHLAAATSTGGFGAKIPGRVGDSPIIGAGVFADDSTLALSATGHGEYFIRFSVARNIADRMRYLRESVGKAADEVIREELPKANVEEAGVIAVDPHGRIAMTFHAEGMTRGLTSESIAPAAYAYERPNAGVPETAR
jgi:isoaspartyl peptidase/L-asparaginase-like protein (Ntn-hydrolase superfamily)